MKGKKKIFAAVLTLCLMLTGVPAAAFGEETAAAGDIVILYSSDIHGGVDSNLGLAGLAAYANEKRAQGSAVELVDAGDAVSGTMLASTTQGRYVVEAMNLAGYGIAVPGVHEFDYGVSGLVGTLSKEAKHQYISFTNPRRSPQASRSSRRLPKTFIGTQTACAREIPIITKSARTSTSRESTITAVGPMYEAARSANSDCSPAPRGNNKFYLILKRKGEKL